MIRSRSQGRGRALRGLRLCWPEGRSGDVAACGVISFPGFHVAVETPHTAGYWLPMIFSDMLGTSTSANTLPLTIDQIVRSLGSRISPFPMRLNRCSGASGRDGRRGSGFPPFAGWWWWEVDAHMDQKRVRVCIAQFILNSRRWLRGCRGERPA